MTQYMRPSSTLRSGGWIAVPGLTAKHTHVDEGVDSHDGDTTYIYARNQSVGQTVFQLSSATDPGDNNDHYWAWVDQEEGDTSAAFKRYKFQLRRISDNGLIWDSGFKVPGGSYAVQTELIPASAIANITDYADVAVTLKVESLQAWSYPPDRIKVTALELRVPDPPPDEELEVTNLPAEVTVDAPTGDLYATTFGVEVCVNQPPPPLYVTSFVAEVRGVKTKLRVSSHGVEITSASPEALLHATTLGLEITVDNMPSIEVTTFGLEIAADSPDPELRVTKTGAELTALRVIEKIHVTSTGVEISGRRRQTQVEPGDLPDVIAKLYLPNWARAITVETAWGTDITRAQNDAESRVAIADRPLRTMECDFLGLTVEESTELLLNLHRFASGRILVPLFPDYASVTAEASGTSIPCDTRYRRFFNGSRVVIHYWERHRFPSAVEYATVAEVKPDELVLDSALSGTFPARARVYPVMECDVMLEADATTLNRQTQELRLTFQELPGKTALPPWVDPLRIPPDLELIDGAPVFPLDEYWRFGPPTFAIEAPGDRVPLGRSWFTIRRGQLRIGWGLTLQARDRPGAWEVLRFLDVIQGRFRSFWLVAPIDFFEPVDLQSTHVDVTPWGNLEDVEAFVPYVAIVKKTGGLEIAEVASVTSEAGPVYRLTFAAPLASLPTVEGLRRVTLAHRVRSKSDAYLEIWQTNEGPLEVALEVAQVHEEGSIAIADVDPVLEDAGAILEVATPFLAVDASRHAVTGANLEDPDLRLVDPANDTDVPIAAVYDLRSTDGPPAGRLDRRVVPADADLFSTLRFAQEPNGPRALFWMTSTLGASTDALQTPPFSNVDGFTFLITYRRGDNAWDADTFMLKRENVFELDNTALVWYEDLGSNDKGFTFADILATAGEAMVLALVWEPGVRLELYKNGTLVGSASSQTTDLDTVEGIPTQFARGRGDGVVNGRDASDQWGTAVLYPEALSNAELNRVGLELADKWGTTWTEVT